MKVLILTNMFPIPGIKPHLGAFIRQQVSELRERGLDVDVAFVKGKAAGGSTFSYIAPLPLARLKYSPRDYDIIHAHHSLLLPMAVATGIRPLIFTCHEGGLFKKMRIDRAFFQLCRNSIDRLVFVSARLAQESGLSALQYDVLPIGVDTKVFHPMDKRDARSRLGLRRDVPAVFFPADPARPEKNYDLAGSAIRILRERRGDIETIVGGSIPHDRMPLFLCASDVVIITSRYEASPTVAKEALACNVPVVSVDVGDVSLTIGSVPGCSVCLHDAEALAGALQRAIDLEDFDGRRFLLRMGLDSESTTDRLLEIYNQALVGKKDEDTRHSRRTQRSRLPDGRRQDSKRPSGREVHPCQEP